MKKSRIAAIALASAMMFSTLTGCFDYSPMQDSVPEWANETELAQSAHDLIEGFNAGDYETIAELGKGVGLTKGHTKDAAESVLPELGAIKSYSDTTFASDIDRWGEPYAIVFQTVEYENGSIEYTVSFYEDGTLAGFFVR